MEPNRFTTKWVTITLSEKEALALEQYRQGWKFVRQEFQTDGKIKVIFYKFKSKL